MGVHTIGSAKLENSGYEGHWSDEENQGIFNNNYYRSIIMKGWGPQYNVGDREDRAQWKRIDLMAGKNDEMMLTTDMCLFYSSNVPFMECMNTGEFGDVGHFLWCRKKHLRKKGSYGAFLDPHKADCCAWSFSNTLFWRGWNAETNSGVLAAGGEYPDFCGMPITDAHMVRDKEPFTDEDGTEYETMNDFQLTKMHDTCCGTDKFRQDCDVSSCGEGVAQSIVYKFAANEAKWLYFFKKAWKKVTTNGMWDWEGSDKLKMFKDHEKTW